MKHTVLIIIVNVLCISALYAQGNQIASEDKPITIDPTLSIGSAHGLLLSGLKIDGYEYLTATLGVSDKGAKLTWAPFLLSNDYNRWYSETRIEVSGDAKNDQSSIGVAFKYNPYNPRSPNGRDVFNNIDLGRDDPQRIIQERLESIRLLKTLARQELSQQNDVVCPALTIQNVLSDKSSVVALNIELIEMEKNRTTPNTQQRKLLRCALPVVYNAVEEDGRNIIRFERTMSDPPTAAQKTQLNNLTKQKKSSKAVYERLNAFAIGIYHAERNDKLKEAAKKGHAASISAENTLLNIEQQISVIVAKNKNYINRHGSAENLKFRKALFKTYKPIVTLSYKGSFFNVIGNRDLDVDSDNNGEFDNKESLASRELSFGVDWPYSETQNLSLIVGRSYERVTADGLSPSSDYNSYGLSWAVRLKVLNDPGYQNSADFKKSLFVPSISFGLSASYRECRNRIDSTCIKNVTQTQEVTPYLDFKISKAAQFRIGIPFIRRNTFIPGMTNEDDPSKSTENDIQIFGAIKFSLGAPS